MEREWLHYEQPFIKLYNYQKPINADLGGKNVHLQAVLQYESKIADVLKCSIMYEIYETKW